MVSYDLEFLGKFVPRHELNALVRFAQGEGKEYYAGVLEGIEKEIRAVPPLYANEEIGLQAPIRLHYFGGATDFWITELDQEELVAFGFACLGGDPWNAELGYSYIPEIIQIPMLELDLYWDSAKTLESVIELVKGKK